MNGIQNDSRHVHTNEINAYRSTEKGKTSEAKGADIEIRTNSKLSNEAKSLLKEMQ